MKELYAARIARVLENLQAQGLEQMIVSDPTTIFYLTGVRIQPGERMLALLLRSTDLGHIPQTLDAVVLASAGKMRLDAPDYVFVLGLAEGEFPCAPAESGLLTHADRDALMAQQVELPDCFENRVIREQVCFYKALTAPAKGLWLSWPKGQGQTLCAAVEPLVDALHPAAPELELTDLAATPMASSSSSR